MKILMVTNTYKPLVGGLERSVESFTKEFRRRGHRVIIVAPKYEGMQKEKDLIRIPAIRRFNGSNFSVQLPLPGVLNRALKDFKPDIVHSHHPFLAGDTALRAAYRHKTPLVFTHHTLFEQNLHYVPGDPEVMGKFVIELATGYANLASAVFAPSDSVKDLLEERGVKTPIEVVPTGIEIKRFSHGAGRKFRQHAGIPDSAFLAGYIGRLAPEKNLEFLAQAAALLLKKDSDAYFLVGGAGPSSETVKAICEKEGVAGRLRMPGMLKGKELVDAYHALDVFAFASQSETQGLVVAEAMSSKVPVVAVDAPGVREVVKDGLNGRLLARENAGDFAAALEGMKKLSAIKMRRIREACRQTAKTYALGRSADKALEIYSRLIESEFVRHDIDNSPFAASLRLLKAQWKLTKNFTKATGALLIEAAAKNNLRYEAPPVLPALSR